MSTKKKKKKKRGPPPKASRSTSQRTSPAFVTPMAAQVVKRLPEGNDWVYVAQIRFVEWTAEGRLRHAAFLGLRSDRSAREVRRKWLGFSGG